MPVLPTLDRRERSMSTRVTFDRPFYQTSPSPGPGQEPGPSGSEWVMRASWHMDVLDQGL